MLNCKDACENATNHLEGPTTLGERLQLRLHLLICRECRRFYRQFQLTIGVSAKLKELDTPSDEEINELVAKLAERAADPSN